MATRTITILRMGKAEPEIEVNHGDYAEWIRDQLSPTLRSDVKIIDPVEGELPAPMSVDGLIITGSSSMVTDPSSSDLKAFDWLQQVVAASRPVLGICYGHQMLGHVLGGIVGVLPGGPEIGVADVALKAADDPLFGTCITPQKVAVIHWQTILQLPPGAEVLGRGKRDPHQIVRFRPNVWGVQFHPEFGSGVMTYYVRSCADDLKAMHLDADQVAAETQDWPGDGTGVIKRFGDIVTAT